MILFWGSKGYQKDLGHTQTAIECGHCNKCRHLGDRRNWAQVHPLLDSTFSLW